jgi:Type II secretory pathway, component PulD
MSTRPFSLALLIVAAFVPSGWAQEQPQPESPAPAVTSEPGEMPAPVDTAPETSEVIIKDEDANRPALVARNNNTSGADTLSVDFPEEDIRNILRNVADLFELNLVIPDTLQGRTSIKLRDVTWRQIFEVVLEPVGYTYVEDGNIIKVVSQASLLQEPVSTEVFIINYARAADIMPTIMTLVDPAAGGRIVIDARTNSLVITERPSRMNRIRPIIEKLDRATDQVMIESKFVEVTDRDVKSVGVNWQALAGYRIGVGGDEEGRIGTYAREQLGENLNSRENTGGNSSQTTNNSTNGTTNNQTTGSTTSNTVTSTNGVPTSTSSTGVNSSVTNTVTSGTTSGVQSTASEALSLLQSLTGGTSNERTLSAVFSADQFNIVLSALRTANNTKVVSNPTIVTLNNSEAVINVGEERPIPNYTFSEQTGTFQISGFTYKPIGVLLRVTPQVNSLGLIKLSIAPEVSQPNGQVAFGGASGTTIPIVATRKAQTQVSLKDGYTMGIGGLLTSSGSKGETKVPVLGSVPVLGRLFRSDTKNTETTNLIIFITARSLTADGAPVEEVFNSERVRGLNMERKELPGYRDGTDPFVEPAPEPEVKKKRKFFGSAD